MENQISYMGLKLRSRGGAAGQLDKQMGGVALLQSPEEAIKTRGWDVKAYGDLNESIKKDPYKAGVLTHLIKESGILDEPEKKKFSTKDITETHLVLFLDQLQKRDAGTRGLLDDEDKKALSEHLGRVEANERKTSKPFRDETMKAFDALQGNVVRIVDSDMALLQKHGGDIDKFRKFEDTVRPAERQTQTTDSFNQSGMQADLVRLALDKSMGAELTRGEVVKFLINLDEDYAQAGGNLRRLPLAKKINTDLESECYSDYKERVREGEESEVKGSVKLIREQARTYGNLGRIKDDRILIPIRNNLVMLGLLRAGETGNAEFVEAINGFNKATIKVEKGGFPWFGTKDVPLKGDELVESFKTQIDERVNRAIEPFEKYKSRYMMQGLPSLIDSMKTVFPVEMEKAA